MKTILNMLFVGGMFLLVVWSLDNIHEAQKTDSDGDISTAITETAGDTDDEDSSDRIQVFPDRIIQNDVDGTTTIIYENDGTLIINHEVTHDARPVVTVIPWPDGKPDGK